MSSSSVLVFFSTRDNYLVISYLHGKSVQLVFCSACNQHGMFILFPPPPKLCGLSSELLSCTIVGLNVTKSVRVRTHVCV